MKATVVFDHVRYDTGNTSPDGRTREYASAYKGDDVDLSQAEFDRLEALGAVAKPRSADAKDAKVEADAVPESDQRK